MRIRENLGGFLAATNNRNTSTSSNNVQIGKVYGIITTENTPTKELFDKNGGWSGIGTIFYLDYEQSKNIDNTELNQCKTAKPFKANIQDYPLIGELILIIDAPGPVAQINNTSSQKYYIDVINLWNNVQQNAPSGGELGNTFVENPNIRNLISFEGDRIYQGRKGNSIRFSSTIKPELNEWSDNVTENSEPITIISNGFPINDNLKSISEKINETKSSIYLTSDQLIPLSPDRKSDINPLTQPLIPNKYKYSQNILNSNRITLNSTKDEVMIFAKTNVEISTNNIINLNANKRVHLNSPTILLGTKNGDIPTEPLLLGNKTKDLLSQLLLIISELGNAMAAVVTTPQGSPLIGINVAGASAVEQIEFLQEQLKNITSTNNYTT